MNKSNKVVKHVTDYRHAEVLMGANIYISTEDARGLLALTDLSKFSEGNITSNPAVMASRSFIRNMAKAVLYRGGDATSTEDLASMFVESEEDTSLTRKVVNQE